MFSGENQLCGELEMSFFKEAVETYSLYGGLVMSNNQLIKTTGVLFSFCDLSSSSEKLILHYTAPLFCLLNNRFKRREFVLYSCSCQTLISSSNVNNKLNQLLKTLSM